MKQLLLILLLFLIHSFSFAQDQIRLKNQQAFDVKIISLNKEQVIFHHFRAPATELFAIDINKIETIKLANTAALPVDSAVAIFTASAEEPAPNAATELYNLGEVHARENYKARGPQVFTFVTSVGAPPVGLVSALVFSTTKPNEFNMVAPDYEMFKNNNYRIGYLREAKKIRQRKTWTAFGVGTLLFGVVYGIVQNN
ncbi:MAG: hypothetical protein LPJ89_11275 [Hymenobacteraceae bacterium]|nr:hypothetical protein [Hymenobacteraceae bacterium]MDX5397952.1 hypothetical protein [Hymenobacteraceae bacterium]MDX5444349.1 hypothetical protein [Hymenobacteraceae bacterium]MDX5514024.1 hypothetical protein [Hymenobacteraceae bacterium]